MGRSSNSFNGWVRAPEVVDGERVTLPEKDLWVAVLCRAVLDACKGPPALDLTRRANVPHKNHYDYNRDQAQHFFLEGGAHFKNVCDMAGRNAEYVQDKIRKVILRSLQMLNWKAGFYRKDIGWRVINIFSIKSRFPVQHLQRS
jgi:hypothetical protein